MRQRNVSKQPHYGTYIPARPCSCGKRGYGDRDAAKAVIKEMRRAGKTRSDRVNAYQCRTSSGYWHVGHPPESSRTANLNDPGTYEGGAA